MKTRSGPGGLQTLVSIVLPTKDRPQFLKEALQSISGQTYGNIEVIVVNDGGEDVENVLSQFMDKLKIIYKKNHERKGPAAARNLGLREARGKYIAYLDDDDIFYPEHIETLVGFLERTGSKVAYSDSYQAFQQPMDGIYVTTDKRVAYSFKFDRKRLLVMNYIPTLNIVHDRECIDEAGFFDETLETQEDWDLWIRMSQRYEFHHIKSVTAEFRTRLNFSSLTSSKRPDFLRTLKIIHSRYKDTAKDPDIIKQQKYVEEELEKELALKAELTLEPGSFTVVEARTGKPSLQARTREGIFKTLHSLYDPETEARNAVDAFIFDGRGIIVVLGLGLGYHVSELSGRYPDAEIIVVEAFHEVDELAKKHAPQFGEKVKLLVGLHPGSVLREITTHQMKGGISPLYVFPLSSEVSAFPSYYQPVLASLKKTVTVKLWEKLKYRKLNKGSLNIILIDSGYFLVQEAEKALTSLHHKVKKIAVQKDTESSVLISKLVEMIVVFQPDFILTINHLGFDEDGVLASFLRSIEMPVASWYVDSPRLILQAFDKNVSPYASIFLWDREYMEQIKHAGFESVIYLPLATAEEIFKPMKLKQHIIRKYQNDVGFVGNSLYYSARERLEKVPESLHLLVEEIACRLSSMRGSFEDVIKNTEEVKLKNLTLQQRLDFEAAVLWKATLLYRLACIEELKQFNACICGDEGWKALVNGSYNIKPPLNYYRELPAFYNSCKINFNATHLQMKEAVNQRVFDVPACGAFILTDYQKSLEGLFDVGKEIIVYRDNNEIPGLVKYYLDNPAKREAVAKKGLERVLKEHTYKYRLDVIIRTMKVRYA
jgi:spore maturation protein CgeB